MKCANLGIDEPYELAGIGSLWRKTKRVASRGVSSMISVAKDSGIPGVSQLASTTRSVGQQTEQYLPSSLRTGSAGPGGSSPAPAPETYEPAKDNTLLYVGVGAVALLLLMKRK